MNGPTILIIVAIAFFAVEEIEARGRSIGWWGAILVGIALVWSRLL